MWTISCSRRLDRIVARVGFLIKDVEIIGDRSRIRCNPSSSFSTNSKGSLLGVRGIPANITRWAPAGVHNDRFSRE